MRPTSSPDVKSYVGYWIDISARNVWLTATFDLVGFATSAGYILQRSPVSRNYLNSYPFLSSDGFNWIYERAYLHALLSGTSIQSLLPHPKPSYSYFVFMLDAMLGSQCIAYRFAFSIAFSLGYLFLLWTLREFGVSTGIRLWTVLLYIVTLAGCFRIWVLADGMAIAFMHACRYFLIRHNSCFALKWLALTMNVQTIGLTGKGGWRMASISDVLIAGPHKQTSHIQEAHITIGHMICSFLEAASCSPRR